MRLKAEYTKTKYQFDNLTIDEKTKILFDFEDIEAHIRQESLMKQKLEELEKFKIKVVALGRNCVVTIEPVS